MRRRRFLSQLAGASAALASPAVFAPGAASVATAAGGPPPKFPSLQYLTCDTHFQDARPCFDPTGQTILFMHQPLDQPDQVWLYTIPVAAATSNRNKCQTPTPFFVDPPLQATRPDWSWTRTSFEIVFSGDGKRLYLLDTKTRKARLVDCQPSGSIVIDTLSYPAWAADGRAIVQTNYSDKALQHQQLLRVAVPPVPPDPFSVVCSAVTDPSQVWPGMCSVSPSDPDLVAFAGQAPNLAGTYDQNWNQIWVQNGSDSASDPAIEVDGIQGRAPWWSPSGSSIAFESILTPTDGFNPFFRIWVMPLAVDPPSVGAVEMVTPADLPVQHAKWSPDGTRIVFAYVIPGAKPVSTPQGDMVPQGIALVDAPSSKKPGAHADIFLAPKSRAAAVSPSPPRP